MALRQLMAAVSFLEGNNFLRESIFGFCEKDATLKIKNVRIQKAARALIQNLNIE
jgi:hypothetical protein